MKKKKKKKKKEKKIFANATRRGRTLDIADNNSRMRRTRRGAFPWLSRSREMSVMIDIKQPRRPWRVGANKGKASPRLEARAC